MAGRLLLVSAGTGLSLRILDLAVADGVAEIVRERLGVGRVTVNGARHGDLATSLKQGCKVAQSLLFREYGRNRSLANVEVSIDDPGATVTGRSAELLFGLAIFLHLVHRDGLAAVKDHQFAATGTLDPLGNIGSVEDLPIKIAAALDSQLPGGSFVFYPRADDRTVNSGLRDRCHERGLHLRPVDRIDEALIALGITMSGGWVGSPFRSLEPYQPEHSRIFFGRQAELTAIVARLEKREADGCPGAMIVGASGAGKSSFCMAGLLPLLARQIPGLEHSIWRPRDAIAGNREDDVAEGGLAGSLVACWRRRDESQSGFTFAATLPDVTSLADLAQLFAKARSARCQYVFVVDQFEELFTLDFTPEARRAFARFLHDLQSHGFWTVGTLRSEFFSQYLDLRDQNGDAILAQVFGDDGMFNLPRMGREALHQVIVRPAELAGLRFEARARDGARLEDAILADALVSEDALPLLGFTLQTLYDALQPEGHHVDQATEQPLTLSFAAYQALGGLKGAIGQIVEPVFAALDADARASLPEVLAHLAVPAVDGLRETIRPASLDHWPANSPGRRLIEALIDIRILISEQGGPQQAPPQICVAHEALFTHWNEAVRILQESRRTRLLIEDFRQRARRWDDEGRQRGALLSSPVDLENARVLRPISSASGADKAWGQFLTDSIEASDLSQRRARRLTTYSVLSAVIALVALTSLTTFLLRFQIETTWARTVMTHRKSQNDLAALPDRAKFSECDGRLRCPRLVKLMGGTFLMGSPDSEVGRNKDEGPQRRVRVRPFAISQYDVTFSDWESCVAYSDQVKVQFQKANHEPFIGCAQASDNGFGTGERPVINVSWEDAQGYVRWLNWMIAGDAAHGPYRLPSEAEWEFAARAGSQSAYYWGNATADLCKYANGVTSATIAKYVSLQQKSAQVPACEDKFLETSPVGSFKPNALGLYDMSGNVWQWVADCYQAYPGTGRAAFVQAMDADWLCMKRTLRGGSWRQVPAILRSAERGSYVPESRFFDTGFRVARSLGPDTARSGAGTQ